jgi:hypothetical protein
MYVGDRKEANKPRLWNSLPAVATESYIQDTRAKLETPLACPPRGPEEKYYEPQGMEGMSSGGVASNWYCAHYSNPPRNRRPRHSHTQAHPPATMVAKTASIFTGSSQYYTKRLTKHIRLILQIGISFNGP